MAPDSSRDEDGANMKLGLSRLFWFLLAVLAAVSLLRGIANALAKDGSRDFQSGPSRALLERKNPYTPYLDYRSGKTQERPYLLSQAPNYPASSYVFLWPYACLSWKAAKGAWALSNVAFTVLLIAGMWRIFPSMSIRTTLLMALLLLIGTPHRNTLGNGQHGLFSLAFFVWALVWDRRERAGLSGFFLAVCWFKYTIGLPLSLYFCARRRFAPLVVASLIHAALIAFVAAWIGQPPAKFLLNPVEVSFLAGGLSGATDPTASGVDCLGIAARLGLPTGAAFAAGILFLVLVTIVLFRAREGDDGLVLSFLALTSFALFPHRNYDWILLIFPLQLLLSRRELDKLTFPLGLLIVDTWYARRALDFLETTFDGRHIVLLQSWLYAFTLLLFYAALFLIGLKLAKSRMDRAAPPPLPIYRPADSPFVSG